MLAIRSYLSIESMDIGDYDSCINGCKYCYANTDPKKAIQNYKLHDINWPMLIGNVRATDIIQNASQISYMKKNVITGQMKIDSCL